MLEVNILCVPVTTLGLTVQNSLGSRSFQTKLKYSKDSCSATNMLQSLMRLQSTDLVCSEITQHNDSVDLGSSAKPVLLCRLIL